MSLDIFNKEEIDTKSLKDQVREKLRTAIITSRLKPGQKIKETEIGRQLGFSQVPVREALRGLEEEGLVKSERFKGSFVTEIDKNEIHHIFLLRSTIECNSLDIIYRNLDQNFINSLLEIVNEMVKIEKTGDYERIAQLDVEFHSLIVSWPKVEVYFRTWNTLNGHIQRYINFSHPTLYEISDISKKHFQLIEALKTKSLGEIKQELRKHILEAIPQSEDEIGKD